MDPFNTHVLVGLVRKLKGVSKWLVNRFFPYEQTEESEEIHFDVDESKPRLAPFVSPVVAGTVVKSQGYTMKTFVPAYTKDKRVFNPNRPLKRLAGEQIGGQYTPAQRVNLLMMQDLADQIDMLGNRLEAMAWEAMLTGKEIITGEGYPTQEVDFGRDAALTVSLTGTNEWGDTGVKPLDNLEAWADIVRQKSGATPQDVVMDLKAWQLFKADADVLKRLELISIHGVSNVQLGGPPIVGGQYKGTIDGFNLFVYAGEYEDDSGVMQNFMPDYTVLMSGPQLLGTQCFGAIQDEEFNYEALPFAPKSWVEKDPAVRMLLMQSAPLVVPYRVNACLAATVKQS